MATTDTTVPQADPFSEASERLKANETSPQPPVEPKSEAKEPKVSHYAVWYCISDKDSTEDEVVYEGKWQFADFVSVENNGGQREARRKAIESDPDLAHIIREGQRVWFICQPRSSFKPYAVELDAPVEPRIKF